MADTLTVSLPAPLADEIRAAAEARGMAPEEYVRVQLAFDVAAQNDGWADEDVAKDEAIAEEFDRTGVGVPWEDVRAWMLSWGTENELPAPRPRKLR